MSIRFDYNKTYRFSLDKAIAAGLTPFGAEKLARYDGIVFKPMNISEDGSHADSMELWGIDRQWCEVVE